MDQIVDSILLNGAHIPNRGLNFVGTGEKVSDAETTKLLAELKERYAAAEVCNSIQRYIFYSTAAIDNLKNGNELAVYFTFAHEIAHHVTGDTLIHGELSFVELDADELAAKWLTRLDASMRDIKGAMDTLNFDEKPRGGYPARCARIYAAIRGYNETARDYNKHGARMKLYEEDNCSVVEERATVTAVAPPVPEPTASGGNFCPLLSEKQAGSQSATASEILQNLSQMAFFDPGTLHLFGSTSSADLRARGAIAQVCNFNERWIFYDPDFVARLKRQTGGTDWSKYFIFAHEVAHHFNNDVMEHKENQEKLADRTAARWLTEMGASMTDLIGAVNAFVINENRVGDYPGRCERVAGVIRAYDEVALEANRRGAVRPIYDETKCTAVEILPRARPNSRELPVQLPIQ